MHESDYRTLDKAIQEAEADGQVFIGVVMYDVAKDELKLRPNACLDKNEINAILQKFDMESFKVNP